jgi:hypothetical protein
MMTRGGIDYLQNSFSLQNSKYMPDADREGWQSVCHAVVMAEEAVAG